HRFGDVDGGYALATFRHMERERAVKAETIKPAAARVAHSRRPILALVKEGAGLLAFKKVDPESNPVLCNEKIAGHCMANWRFVFVLFISGLRGRGQTTWERRHPCLGGFRQ